MTSGKSGEVVVPTTYALSKALQAIWRVVSEANAYFQGMEPWTLAKDPGKKVELDHVVRAALEALAAVARMVAPVMPVVARQILAMVGMGTRAGDAAKPYNSDWYESGCRPLSI